MYDSGPLKLTTVEQGEGIDLLSDDSCEPAANANANANQVVPSKDQSEEDSQKQRTQSRKRRHPSGESTSGSKHHLTADYMARTREASTSPGPNFRCQTPRMGSPSIRSPGPRNSYTSPSLSRESLRSLSPNMRSFSPLMCLKLRCNVSSPGIPAKHSKQMDKVSALIDIYNHKLIDCYLSSCSYPKKYGTNTWSKNRRRKPSRRRLNYENPCIHSSDNTFVIWMAIEDLDHWFCILVLQQSTCTWSVLHLMGLEVTKVM